MAQPHGPQRTYSASSDHQPPSSPITSSAPGSTLLSAAAIGQQRQPGPNHQHSHSHSGYPAGLQHQQQGGNNHLPAPAQRGPRSSVDAQRSLNVNTAGFGQGQLGAGMGAGQMRGARPASEMLPGGTGFNTASPEAEAIDRWFNDLQHYEATLEEMAAASLDTNFKEELSAIEQWFRVLSEAERTAALYSLLQQSTQVQIRFFITVLQQMGKANDPSGVLLSPVNPHSSMEAQMEARLSAMKGPASPATRQFARASLGPDPTNYLSPSSALYDTNDVAASTLAQQRAKLKSQAHRISAPGTLTSAAEALKSPLWSQAHSEQVAERNARSPSPNPSDSGISGRGRPKSTGSDLSAAGNAANNFRSPRTSMLMEDNGMSPMPGGSWASMVNTPLVPMFKNEEGEAGPYAGQPQSPQLDVANSRLGWGSNSTTQQQQQQSPGQSGIVLDDARKFRRTGRVSDGGRAGVGLGQLPSTAGMGALGALGGASTQAGGQQQQQQQPPIGGVSFDQSGNFMMPPGGQGQQGRRAVSGPVATGGNARPGASNNAALAAQQNWRNGLLSASANGSLSAGPGQTAFAPGASMGGTSPNLSAMSGGFATPQDFSNLNLLVQQQQQQLQLQQNLINLGMSNMAMLNASGGPGAAPNSASLLSPNQMAMAMGANAAAQLMGGQSPGLGARRSPRASDRGLNASKTPGPVPGSGANPEEAIDDNLLANVSDWLRSLRLHKYTTNFEGTRWQDLVMMDEAALEARGVSALGARRKLLKVFEVVRSQKGIPAPAGLTVPAADLGRAASPSGASSSAHDEGSSVADD